MYKEITMNGRKVKRPLIYTCHFCGKRTHRKYISTGMIPSLSDTDYGKAKLIWNCEDCGASYHVSVGREGIGEIVVTRSEKINPNITNLLDLVNEEE